jgi:hypothetical protein
MAFPRKGKYRPETGAWASRFRSGPAALATRAETSRLGSASSSPLARLGRGRGEFCLGTERPRDGLQALD